MFKEYDTVVAKVDIGQIPKDSLGAVLIVFANSNDYEVEFIDKEGNSLGVLTVSENDLLPFKKKIILMHKLITIIV